MVYNGPPSAAHPRQTWRDAAFSFAVLLVIVTATTGMIAFAIYTDAQATAKATKKTYTVRTSTGETFHGLRIDGGGWGWTEYLDRDGRILTVTGPHTCHEEASQ